LKVVDLIEGYVADYSRWRDWYEKHVSYQPALDSHFIAKLYTICVDCTGCDQSALDRTLESLLAQIFRNIEVLVIGATADIKLSDDHRIRGYGLRGISFENNVSRDGLWNGTQNDSRWRGDMIGIVAAGTTFDAWAFQQLDEVLYADKTPLNCDLALFDWDLLLPNGKFDKPCFMPGFDDLLYGAVDYIGDAVLISKSMLATLRKAGPVNTLRSAIVRLSFNSNAITFAHVQGPAVHFPQPPGADDASFALPLPHIAKLTASVIIPNKNSAAMLKTCISTLRVNTNAALEIIVVDNASADTATLKLYRDLKADMGALIVPANETFNFSLMINRGVAASSDERLVLLNNDVEFTKPGELDAMIKWSAHEQVGAVGSVLIDGNGLVQHAGVVYDWRGYCYHVLQGAKPRDRGYLGALELTRSWDAVTGAVLATRRVVYDDIGGLEEQALPVEYNDVDYCFVARAQGYRVVCLANEGIKHLESVSRGRPQTTASKSMSDIARAYLQEVWHDRLEHDSFNNPWFKLGLVARPKFMTSLTTTINPGESVS
jgi:GT2 family glycosyltransferase